MAEAPPIPNVPPIPDTSQIPDAAERARALDPAASFIVQAPAGSGKTELLIQRYLVLLARVEQPESVVAITFTKKAAGEMRRRVLEALEAASGFEPEKPHLAHTWRLARDVRARDAACGWGIADNPSRLRIRTIDSVCDSITRRMPWLSRLGAAPAIEADAAALYREAARRTISLVEDDAWAQPLETILLHLDNDAAALESLLAEMLGRRDQWLRHIAGTDLTEAREALEESLERIVTGALAAVCRAFPADLAAELLSLARYASCNVDPDDAVAACGAMEELPGHDAADLAPWCALASLLLTKAGSWRAARGVNRSIGFPPASKTEKQRFSDLLDSLRACDGLDELLDRLRKLPPAKFDDRQWEVLAALIPVLKCAAAQLNLAFGARGGVDFIAIARAAITALGDAENPTDLALALDYKIQHLLIDEFQDTSITHFDLLQKLTAGWEPGDGRTLFAVGDPMQSIYRFREAEVGLFLKAAREGIGSVRLVPLRLSANFRSGEGLVAWVNATFPAVLAASDDIANGAVRFSASRAVRAEGADAAVEVHPFVGDRDDRAEAECVVEIVQQERLRDPQSKIAVLVRARTHLRSILTALRGAGIRYRAIEIDELGEVSVTLDLLALTRALLHAADRLSWLAILRAPWCGLTLGDLHALTAGAPHEAVWTLMQDHARVRTLSADGQARLRRVREAIETALEHRGARLRTWVEGCWVALGGPACATGPGDAENALAFLDLLDELDEGGDADIDALAAEVERLYAGPDPDSDDSLQVMTIHKAKGLEFDVVLLPGLGRATQVDPPRLLAWVERPLPTGGADLLLAPIKPAGAGSDPLYAYVTGIERDKAGNETGRQLYVAATRAKRQLHLLGHAGVDRKTGAARKPGSTSLLGRLWPAVEAEFQAAAAALVGPAAGEASEETPAVRAVPIRRLTAGWSLPAPPPSVAATVAGVEIAAPGDAPVTFEWVGDTLRHIGTVVHRMLEQVAREGMAAWSLESIEARRPAMEAALRTLGVPSAGVAEAVEKVARAVAATLEDERGRWILDGSHAEAQSEYAVTGIVDGRMVTARVDRTFVDENGVRWIVDFKTSSHEGGDIEAFLDNERERYRKPMTEYAALFEKLDARPVRMGLYFPLLGGWREYTAATTG
jgi:ATP-dependent helicase/nuclease subunit A